MMNFKVKCPKCEKVCKVTVDTGIADNGDIYYDGVECECDEAFILRTEINADTTVLAVSPPEIDMGWMKIRKVKELLDQLTKQIAL